MKILQQGPARSMGGGASVDESLPQKKTGGARQNAGGPGPPGPPHATGLVRARRVASIDDIDIDIK